MKAKFELDRQLSSPHISLCKYGALRNLPHWHREHELIIMNKGRGVLRMDNCSYALVEGSAALVPAESIHDITCEDDSITEIIKFTLPSDGELSDYALPAVPLISDSSLSVLIHSTVEIIRGELETKSPYYRSSIDCRLELLLIAIARTVPCGPPRRSQATASGQPRRLLSLIERDYATVTFSSAARSVGFCETYFSEYFKEICGMTFTSYLNLIRVGEAVRMLRDEKRTATETAMLCGFGCIRSFNRIFKKLTGYSPTSLPSDYEFVSRSHQDDSRGFDPTLPPTVLISDLR